LCRAEEVDQETGISCIGRLFGDIFRELLKRLGSAEKDIAYIVCENVMQSID
jgi:hypothetical protein